VKILIVKPHLPIPPTQGTRRVTLGLLRDLASEHDVAYLTMLESRDEERLIPDVEKLGVTVRASLMPNRRSLLHRVYYRAVNDTSAFLTGYPRDYYYSTPGILAEALDRWTREEAFDLVVLEYWKLGRLLPFVRSGRPVVLAHDAEFVKRARERAVLKETAGGGLSTWRLERESRREIETLRHCPTILALTERDRSDLLDAFGGAYRGEIHVLPVGVDLPAGLSGVEPDPVAVGFLGSFKADFNVDSLRYFLNEIWPEIRKRNGAARLLVAGGDLPPEFESRSGENGIRFLGYVEDLAEYVASLSVFVVPLRYGGGLRIRLIEALSMGAAVVATSVAVAGLELDANSHYLEADDPVSFAEAVGRVLADGVLRERLVEEGRRIARERYESSVTRRRTLELFRELGDQQNAA